MLVEKVYLNPDLTVDMVAKYLCLRKDQVSQFLNEELGLHFNKFINEYRISDAKKLLLSEDYSVLVVGLKVGFNSKSAFNAAFKNIVKMTPSHFKKSSINS